MRARFPESGALGTGNLTEEELDALHHQLQGPLGDALRQTGVILERRLRERGVSWEALTDDQVAQAFVSAFTEAAMQVYPDADRSTIDQALAVMSETLKRELSATAPGGRMVN